MSCALSAPCYKAPNCIAPAHLTPLWCTPSRRRSEADVVPIFRKFDPKHYDSRTGKPIQKGKRGGDGSPPKPIPGLSFSRLLISAFLMHRVRMQMRGLVGGWGRHVSVTV